MVELTHPSDLFSADMAAGFSYAFDCGAGFGTPTSAASATCIAPDNPSHTVTMKITEEGGEQTYPLVVEVPNVAPIVGVLTVPAGPVRVNTEISASGAFTDAGILDTHTALVDWGDSSTAVGMVSEADGAGTVSANHTYTAAGVYTVTLEVTDKDGGVGRSFYRYVVYDPDAGFVTGGSWIDSPAGTYTPDPSLTGKASFGFVSKYQKGGNCPNWQHRIPVQCRRSELPQHELRVAGDLRTRSTAQGLGHDQREWGVRLPLDGQRWSG